MNMLKKATFATAFAASALVSAAPAEARPYHHGGDTAAWAIGAGILGLAVGAAVASDHHDRDYDRRYYDNGYYNGGYYNGAYVYRDGAYYDRDGRRYDHGNYDRYRGGDDSRRGYGRDDYYSRRGW